MNNKETIKKYLKGLEKAKSEEILKLFSTNAIIHSPLYGPVKATKFYQELFGDTTKSTIKLLNIFETKTPKILAGHFRYKWILKNKKKTEFECVDIFKFDNSGKITRLTIIYDTAKIRNSFEKLKKKK